MSPIFVRPVREQLEHDRLIRHLLAKYKKKFEVAANPGDEQLAPVKIAATTFFPDLVLTDGKKVVGIVEIETGESVNNLEAMYQWVPFAKARVPFHLYVPVQGYDAARRLTEANQARIAEIWTYRPANDGFDLVRMSAESGAQPAKSLPITRVMPPKEEKPAPAPTPEPKKAAPKVAAKPAPRPAPKPAKSAAKPVAKPAAKTASKAAAKPAAKKAALKPKAKPKAKPAAKAKPKKPAGRKGR